MKCSTVNASGHVKQQWLSDRKMSVYFSEAIRGSKVHTVQEVSRLACETQGIAPTVQTRLYADHAQSPTPVLVGSLRTVLTTLVSVSLREITDNGFVTFEVEHSLHCLNGKQMSYFNTFLEESF